jgi:hypothetical protein
MGGYVKKMGGYVGSVPACYGSSVGSNPKIQNGLHITARQKNIYMKNLRVIYIVKYDCKSKST